MRHTRIERPKVRRERSWLDVFPLGVFPLDLGDPDIVRAKAIDRSGNRQSGTTPVRAPVRDS